MENETNLFSLIVVGLLIWFLIKQSQVAIQNIPPTILPLPPAPPTNHDDFLTGYKGDGYVPGYGSESTGIIVP